MEETEEPFLVAPPEDGVGALRSITEWPSLTGISLQPSQSSADAARMFQSLPVNVQKEFAKYPILVKQAFHSFAMTGDTISTVEWVFGMLPAMLLRTDQYGDIPMEVAFESANVTAARLMLRLAAGSGILERLLAYRNKYSERTLMMAAVNLNSPESADILEQLISHDPCGLLHRYYDHSLMNVFHICALQGFEVSFKIILETLRTIVKSTSSPIRLNEIRNALEMTDNKRLTPIHYICASGKVEMLDGLHMFLTLTGMRLDFDVSFKGADNRTPLIVGIEKGHYDVCKWLVEMGAAVNWKQYCSCLTPLHFAVRTGDPRLISLLMFHKADAEFFDDDCKEATDYKTPLQMAQTEAIPNKAACIQRLTEPVGLSLWD